MARHKQGIEALRRAPAFVPFQLARLVPKPPEGDQWLHEIKFDGYRMQVRVEAGQARFFTRNGLDWTGTVGAPLVAAAGALPDCVVDGELCAVNAEGYSDFSALRSALGARGRKDALAIFAFDLLFEAGEDLRPYALTTRKARLRAVLERADPAAFRYVEECPFPSRDLLTAACRLGFEGIVSKRRDAPYRGGPGDTWLKAKCRPGIEVVVGGWRTDGARFRSLIAGIYEPDGRLRYAGRIHTGYSDAEVEKMMPILRMLETDVSPFEVGQVPKKTRDVHWMRPRVVADVEMAEITAGGKLRQASFKGLRADKTAEDLRADAMG
jgi:bifunctional non-homologous end joining protein LigD